MARSVITGTPFEVGESLGRLARPFARRIVSFVRRDARPMDRAGIPALQERIRAGFPAIWEELHGMATGLGLDTGDVLLWNCLQDSAASGASNTVVINRLGYRLVLNKRDPALPIASACALVDVCPQGLPGFSGLYIPGCLPGATFAANRAGIAQVVDPVAGEVRGEGLPTFVIARAVLDTRSLVEAIDLVMECGRSAPAYHILASTQEFVTVAIEASPAGCALAPIPNRHWHTNHFIDKAETTADVDNDALRQRFAALSSLMNALPDHPCEDDVLPLLDPTPPSDIDAAEIRPSEGGIGTACLKLAPGRIDIRLYRWQEPAAQHRFVTIPHDRGFVKDDAEACGMDDVDPPR